MTVQVSQTATQPPHGEHTMVLYISMKTNTEAVLSPAMSLRHQLKFPVLIEDVVRKDDTMKENIK